MGRQKSKAGLAKLGIREERKSENQGSTFLGDSLSLSFDRKRKSAVARLPKI
jgi:hypothetical protein